MDGFFGRIFGEIFGGIFGRMFGPILRRRAWDKIALGIPLYFSGLFGHFQNPPKLHLCMMGHWQVGRSMSSPFKLDPCPDHARATSCTPPSLNLHNVPGALLPSVSLTLSIFVSFSSSSDVRLRTAVPERSSVLTKRFISYSRGDLHGGWGWGLWGVFNIRVFHLESPVPIRIYNSSVNQMPLFYCRFPALKIINCSVILLPKQSTIRTDSLALSPEKKNILRLQTRHRSELRWT